jgi:chromosomal replication initiator protein
MDKMKHPKWHGAIAPVGSVTRLKEFVADEFGVPVAELSGFDKSRSVSRPRHVAMWLCRELLGLTLGEIGRLFHRDHSTVRHALDVVPGYWSHQRRARFLSDGRTALGP